MGDAATRRPGRRGDQDRGPGERGRRRPLRAAVSRRRGLAVLRDVQPRQAQRVARPALARGAGGVRGPRAGLGRGLLEPARRSARQAAAHVRGPATAQSTDRVLLAVGLRDLRAAACGAGLRLRAAGADGLDGADRRARRAAGEIRALDGRLLGRLRVGAGAGGGCVARASRRRRLRLRHLAVRDGLVAADLRRDVGRVVRARHRAARRVRAPVDRALPGVSDRGWLDHGRGGQAEVLAGRVRGAGARARRRRAVRGLRRALPAPRGAARDPAPAVAGVDDGGRDRAALEHGVPCGAVNDVLGCSTIRRSRRATRSCPTRTRGSARCGSSPRRCGWGRRYTPAPARGEDTEPLLRELCGYDDARLRAAREEGAFG